jgi:hypothetical protein
MEAKAYVPPRLLQVVLSSQSYKNNICLALQDQIGNPNTKDEILFLKKN